MIISRYLTKEVFNSLLAVTLVLLLILLSQQWVRYLSYAASGKVAANILLQIAGFEIPNLLAILLPLGLFLGIILTYGRLYSDNELRVLHACGFSMERLTGITCVFALMTSIVVLVLMLWINPSIAADKQKLLASNSIDNLLGTLIPGRFQVSSDGKRVVYVEKISRDHRQANNVFVAQQGKNTADDTGTPWTVLSARAGHQMIDPKTKQSFIVTDDGYRYEGTPGQNNYKIIQFTRYAVHLPNTSLANQRQYQEAVPTRHLLATYNNPQSVSELQWRLSIPISALILAVLAIPLSQVKPRQSRYAVLLPALLIYVTYMNLLFAGRSLIEQKVISPQFGLWWVHLIVLLFAALAWRVRSI